MLPFAYFRKEIVPFKDAKITIASHSLHYGTSCFGGIRGYLVNGKIKIFRLRDHYERLKNAVKILGMDFQISWEDFQDIIKKMAIANAPKSDFYIRPIIFSEDQALKPRFDGVNYGLAIYMFHLGPYYDLSKGLRIMISSWRKVSDSSITTKAKTSGFYVNSALASSEARNCGYDEALMMDEQGCIVEASVANLFIVYRDEIYMPDLGSAMLEGITRRTVIDFLKEEGVKINTERIDRSMVYTSQELILTGTAIQIMFGVSVDNRVISPDLMPGPVCVMLRKKLTDVIQGNHPNSERWMTEV